MNHYIVTRIGISLDRWKKNPVGALKKNPDVIKRFELFKETALKSYNLSDIKPKWVFLVGEDEIEIQEELKKYGDVLAVNTINYGDKLHEYITVRHDGFSIVTRFDSDDYVAPNYFGEIQRYAKEYNKLFGDNDYWLSFINGLLYDYNEDKSYTFDKMYTNMFLSVIHKGTHVGSSIHNSYGHYEFYKQHRGQHIITEEPMWALNIHGENVSTTKSLIKTYINNLIDNPKRVGKI